MTLTEKRTQLENMANEAKALRGALHHLDFAIWDMEEEIIKEEHPEFDDLDIMEYMSENSVL